MSNIKAVIFDLDGTLIDTEKFYRVNWPKSAAHFGYKMTDEQALAMANGTKFGLQMSVYTSSMKRAFWYQSRPVAGNICINESCGFWEPHQPFGG